MKKELYKDDVDRIYYECDLVLFNSDVRLNRTNSNMLRQLSE